MSWQPDFTPPTDPRLVHRGVEALRLHLAGLPWLQEPHGLVQTGTMPTADGKTYRYPQEYSGNGGPYFLNLSPTNGAKALSFFEQAGPWKVIITDHYLKDGVIESPLALVVTGNLQLIDAARLSDYTMELLQDVLYVFNTSGVDARVTSIDTRAEKILERYNVRPEERQVTMYPRFGFKVNFTLVSDYAECGAAATPNPCPDQACAPYSGSTLRQELTELDARLDLLESDAPSTLYEAGADLGGGRLVILQNGKLAYYDPTNLSHWGRLLGFTRGAVVAGALAEVSREGSLHRGGASEGAVFFAAPDGLVTEDVPQSGILHEVGTGTGPGEIQFNPLQPFLLS